ncbi:MAG TPA: hypothetical protein VN814_23170 [Caulobacteraceae bacterium]|nr:hypothetical protein [Caulobacteraceae bacterium]
MTVRLAHSRHIGPWLRAWLIGTALVVGAAVAPGGANAGSYADDGKVGVVCASIVGVQPGEKHYAACVESLSRSLDGLRAGEGMELARQGCLAHGYQPNTSGLAECELAAAAPAPTASGPDYPAANPGGSRSYFLVSRETAFRRDQLACARLGFDPTQAPFGDCAADLRAALARASEPAM